MKSSGSSCTYISRKSRCRLYSRCACFQSAFYSFSLLVCEHLHTGIFAFSRPTLQQPMSRYCTATGAPRQLAVTPALCRTIIYIDIYILESSYVSVCCLPSSFPFFRLVLSLARFAHFFLPFLSFLFQVRRQKIWRICHSNTNLQRPTKSITYLVP